MNDHMHGSPCKTWWSCLVKCQIWDIFSDPIRRTKGPLLGHIFLPKPSSRHNHIVSMIQEALCLIHPSKAISTGPGTHEELGTCSSPSPSALYSSSSFSPFPGLPTLGISSGQHGWRAWQVQGQPWDWFRVQTTHTNEDRGRSSGRLSLTDTKNQSPGETGEILLPRWILTSKRVCGGLREPRDRPFWFCLGNYQFIEIFLSKEKFWNYFR